MGDSNVDHSAVPGSRAPKLTVSAQSSLTVVSRGLLWAIGLYQAASAARRPRCRYLPTCSHYAAQAVARHGAARGSWLALRRLLRCQPLGSFGFDPVPER